MKNRDLVFHTHVQMPILEGTFSCKRLYNFVLYLRTFSLLQKGSGLKTYFELHAVMLGDYIV